MKESKRRFISVPDAYRCKATITLKDKSRAQCGRQRRYAENYCFQHLSIGDKP